MNTESLWQAVNKEKITYPKLEETIETDVVIVGGGITGITAAIQLIKAGYRVVILEANHIGGGTTGNSTGNLYIAVQQYYQSILSKFGEEAVRTIAHSRKTAIDFIEQTIKERNINCDFLRRPWYFYTNKEDHTTTIDKEFEALTNAGIAIEYINDMPLPLPFIKAVKMDHQAKFNPLKYVTALAESMQKSNCKIYENSTVISFKEEDCICNTSTSHGKIISEKVILATHIPIGFNMIQTLAIPYRSYVVSARLNQPCPNGNFWDTEEPHHATSTHNSSPNGEIDLLMVAGNHHKTGQTKENDHLNYYKKLEEYLRSHYNVASIEYYWSAQHYQPADGVPYIGKATRDSENIFMATGYSADGLTYGTVAGILLADLITGKDNVWTKIYDSTRFTPIASSAKFINENANVFAQYLKDYVGKPDAEEFSEIKNGEGKTLEKDGEKIAAYRDEQGELHLISAVCTHLKCIVNWNNAEKSWDCPCHGSRFTYEGKVIEGPAIFNLEKIGVSTLT